MHDKKINLAEAQFGSDFIYSCSFRIFHQFQTVLRGILKHKCYDQIKTNSYNKVKQLQYIKNQGN